MVASYLDVKTDSNTHARPGLPDNAQTLISKQENSYANAKSQRRVGRKTPLLSYRQLFKNTTKMFVLLNGEPIFI